MLVASLRRPVVQAAQIRNIRPADASRGQQGKNEENLGSHSLNHRLAPSIRRDTCQNRSEQVMTQTASVYARIRKKRFIRHFREGFVR